MAEYIRIFKEICDEFSAKGKPIIDKYKMFYLLIGLGHEYESFVTTMLKPSRPTYSELVSQLQSHEIIRTINSDSVTGTNHNMVFMVQCQVGRGRNFPRKGKYSSNQFTSKGNGFTHSNQFPNKPRNFQSYQPSNSSQNGKPKKDKTWCVKYAGKQIKVHLNVITYSTILINKNSLLNTLWHYP